MITNDLICAYRNLRRNRLLAVINVIGLSIGISACLIIFLIASYELSFDRFQPEKDRIYRVYSSFSGAFSALNRGVATGIPIAIAETFTGIESVTNFHTFSAQVEIEERAGNTKDFGNHDKIILAGPEYFQVFSYYEWIAGNPQQSLKEPFKVVLTESRAKIYFGDMAPMNFIGKEIHYRDSLIVTVSGIIKDITARTDFDFTDFISFSTVEKSWLKDNQIHLNNWEGTNSSSQLFIKVTAGTTMSKLNDQIPLLTRRYAEHNKDADWSNIPKVQPLSDLHFNLQLGIFDHSRTVASKSTLQTLIMVAVVLLIIGSINFINLETAQASRRAKEVGVRKVLGSSRRNLIKLFLIENFILCLLAILLSVFISFLAIKYFADYIPQGLVFDFSDPAIYLFLLTCLIAVTFLAGLYPALIISSYQPALALKNLAGTNSATSRSSLIRKILTVFQFSFSQILIIATVAIGLQLNFMMRKDLGFTSDAIVFIQTPWGEHESKRQVFKNELSQIPELETFSFHQSPPSHNSSSSSILSFDNGKELLKHNVFWKHADTSYLRLYNIELLAGRNVLPIDSALELVINETYMHQLGFTQPLDVIGKTVDKQSIIVGVVNDFHTQSLHAKIEPTAIAYRSNQSGVGLKLATGTNKIQDIKTALVKIEGAWDKVYPGEHFHQSFLDDTIKRFYETEERTGKLARFATGIAIFISCLGLYGLSSFTVIQRTKEIGIRKVLGATVNSILFLLSKDFLVLVLIACLISSPIAYYLSKAWLEEFAYRIEFTGWIFLISAAISLIIALITIGFRTVNAAQSDPVKSLKYE